MKTQKTYFVPITQNAILDAVAERLEGFIKTPLAYSGMVLGKRAAVSNGSAQHATHPIRAAIPAHPRRRPESRRSDLATTSFDFFIS